MRTATFIFDSFAKENLIDRIFSLSTLNVSSHLPPVSFISDKLTANFIVVSLYMMNCYSVFASKLSHLCLPAVYDVASVVSLCLLCSEFTVFLGSVDYNFYEIREVLGHWFFFLDNCFFKFLIYPSSLPFLLLFTAVLPIWGSDHFFSIF